jgi:hypothetical protein
VVLKLSSIEEKCSRKKFLDVHTKKDGVGKTLGLYLGSTQFRPQAGLSEVFMAPSASSDEWWDSTFKQALIIFFLSIPTQH